MSKKKGASRVEGGWLVDGQRLYADPQPEGQHVPEGHDTPGRRRFVGLRPPPGRFDVPTSFGVALLEKNGKIYMVALTEYWAGGAWHVPRWSSPLPYSGTQNMTVKWGHVDGPRIIIPYQAINENGTIKVIDIPSDKTNPFITPYIRRVWTGDRYSFSGSMSPSEAVSWYEGVPSLYDGNANAFAVPYPLLFVLLTKDLDLAIQKFDTSSYSHYMETVNLVSGMDISISTRDVPLVKYSLNDDGTIDTSSYEPLGTIKLPVATFTCDSFLPSYSDTTVSDRWAQSFTAYPGFRFAYVGAYFQDGDYYYMPAGFVIVEFGVLVHRGKIYDAATGQTPVSQYDYYRVITETSDIVYPPGHADKDIVYDHEPFLQFSYLNIDVYRGGNFEVLIAPITTPFAEDRGFPESYPFPLGALYSNMWESSGSDALLSTGWPRYFSCPNECTLPLANFDVGKAISGAKLKRIVAKYAGQPWYIYKIIPYNFPEISNGPYIDGMRYGQYDIYDDMFVLSVFVPLSSGASFFCYLPPLSPHPYSSLRNYIVRSRNVGGRNILPPTLDARTINAAIGDVPIYTGPLGTIPRPFSDQTGEFMGVRVTASTPFALAAVRMPSDPNKIWGLLIQDGLVRVWLWDGTILDGWSDYPLSSDGTLDIPLQDWLVAPNLAHIALSSIQEYDPNTSLGGGLHAHELAGLVANNEWAPLSLDWSPVMMNNYLSPNWPSEVDFVGFDYQYKDYVNGLSLDHLTESFDYALPHGVKPELVIVHVAYVDIPRQGAMPGASKRVPVVPVFANLAKMGS